MRRIGLIGLLLALPASIALAVVSGPIDPSSTAQAVGAGLELAGDIAAHKWQPAIAIALMLLVWAGHQPFAAGFLGKLGKWHNPVILGLGGALSAIADHILSGGTWGMSAIMGVLTPLLATGAWEHVNDPRVAAKDNAKDETMAALAAARAITDPAERAKALDAVAEKFKG